MEDVNQAPVSTEPIVEETKPQVLAGDKTPPNLLLESLQEERERRRELEARITLLETSSSDVFSDEGQALQKQIKEQDAKIESLLQESAKKDVLITYPVMKEKWEEFETFRSDPDNKGMNLRTAVKAYLLEEGILEPQRKGLEKTTGGPRVPVTQEMSAEDIKKLRETDFRKYQDMLSKGQIPI